MDHYKKKSKDLEAAYKALEETYKEKEDKLRQRSWKHETTTKNLREEIKNLKEDEKHLSHECANLGNAHERCSEIIDEQKARLASLQILVDGTDRVIDNIYYQV